MTSPSLTRKNKVIILTLSAILLVLFVASTSATSIETSSLTSSTEVGAVSASIPTNTNFGNNFESQSIQEEPKAPLFYTLESFLDAFSTIKTTIGGVINKSLSLTTGNATRFVQNDLSELLTPAQFAHLSLQLTPMCQNHPELFNTPAEAVGNETNPVENATLSSKRQFFNTIYPNTVVYVVSNDIQDDDITVEVDQPEGNVIPVIPGLEVISREEEEEDSMVIAEVDDAGNSLNDNQNDNKTYQNVNTTSVKDEKKEKKVNIDKKKTQIEINHKNTKLHYEFSFNTFDLSTDLPNFDNKIKQFINQQEELQFQRDLQILEQSLRQFQSRRTSLFRFTPHSQQLSSKFKTQLNELDQAISKANIKINDMIENKGNYITKLDFKRQVKYSEDELDIKFNNFNNLLQLICHDDQYRTAAEKRNVITHAQLAYEGQMLTWKQYELSKLIQQQDEKIQQRRIQHQEVLAKVSRSDDKDGKDLVEKDNKEDLKDSKCQSAGIIGLSGSVPASGLNTCQFIGGNKNESKLSTKKSTMFKKNNNFVNVFEHFNKELNSLQKQHQNIIKSVFGGNNSNNFINNNRFYQSRPQFRQATMPFFSPFF
jgi:hypothetical protein